MTKETLSVEVGDILELPRIGRKGTAYKIIQVVQKVIVTALLKGERIKIDGFGIFEIVERPPTKHAVYYFYGLRKKNYWEIKKFASKKYVKFKPSKALVRFINDGSYKRT